ncbi:hypothetical protein ABEB36_013815 [Hypothenemus hampei]|uniref:Uncharacterized protein n=1 Tax=Hypothenemus hampei TaxID=57062 RepID=A0ABD1E5D9_HYPHA
METLNKLAIEQEKLGLEVQQLLTNMKKDPTVRKTAEYCTSKEEVLSKLWQQIQSNHAKINELGMEEHSYHKTDYFQQIESIFVDAIAYIKACREKLQASAASQREQQSLARITTSSEQSKLLKQQKVRIMELEETLSVPCGVGTPLLGRRRSLRRVGCIALARYGPPRGWLVGTFGPHC